MRAIRCAGLSAMTPTWPSSDRLHIPLTPSVTISKRGEERVISGHPWIYRTDVTNVKADAGAIVTVRSATGRLLGQALFSDRSQITLRMLTHGAAVADREWLRQRITEAVAFRDALHIEASAYRLVHGEADLLPSLVVDRYGDYLVLQALSQGMDTLTPVVVETLNELLRPAGVLARNDPRARVLEGLEQNVELLSGEVPPVVHVHELGVHYDVDVWHGQKTGLFLDQRENRAAAAGYATGRVLDCFSYNGGFALALAGRARETIAFDISEDAVTRIRRNAERNHVTVDARVGNVFDELRGLDWVPQQPLDRAPFQDRPRGGRRCPCLAGAVPQEASRPRAAFERSFRGVRLPTGRCQD